MSEKTQNRIIDMTYIITTILSLCPMIYGIIMWNKLPESMPIHFGSNNEPDRMGPRWVNVYLMPVVLAVLNTVVHLSFNIKAKKTGENPDSKFTYVYKWLVPLLSFVVNFLVYSYSLGLKLDIVRIVVIVMSLFFIILGNYFPKAEKWMFNVPVSDEKLPWLKRTIGWSFVADGIISLAFAFTSFGIWVFLGATLVVVVGIIYCASKAEN